MKRMLYDDKLIVITGAAGFIGSNVVRHLNDRGYANLLLVDDCGASEKWKNLRHKRFVDLISRRDLFDFLKGRETEIEAFVHLGACADTLGLDGDDFMRNNYRFSVALAEYALTHGHRFIYASSAATYGDGSAGFVDDVEGLDLLEPLNLYGFSKHLFDKWLWAQNAFDRVVGLKYFNIFGPNEWHKGRMGSMVLHMVDQIEKSGKVRLFRSSDPDRFEDGGQHRDFYYVKDAVRMTCFFLDHDLQGLFNAGSGETHTWNELAQIVFDLLGERKEIEYIPMPEGLVGQYQNATRADMGKFWRCLEKKGYTFSNAFTFASAVEDYIAHHLSGRRCYN